MRKSSKLVIAALIVMALSACERHNNQLVQKNSDNVTNTRTPQEKDWDTDVKYETTFFAKQDVICRSGGVITDDFKSVDVVKASTNSYWLKIYVNKEFVYMSGDCTFRPSKQQ